MGDLAPNWSRAEFEAASGRRLTVGDSAAIYWWTARLQKASDSVGRIRLTSFIRPGDTGAHGTADAVDLVPMDVSMRVLADWLAVNMGALGVVQVIHERNHVHVARRLVPGARAGYLDEPREDVYVAAKPDPARISEKDYRALLAVGVALAVLVVVAG